MGKALRASDYRVQSDHLQCAVWIAAVFRALAARRDGA